MRVSPLRAVLCGVALAGNTLLLSGCGGAADNPNVPQTAEEARKHSLESIPAYAKKGGPPPPGNAAK